MTVLEVEVGDERSDTADCAGHALESICSGGMRIRKVNSATFWLFSMLKSIVVVSSDKIRGRCQTGQLVLHFLRELLVGKCIGESIPDQSVLLNRKNIISRAFEKKHNHMTNVDVFQLAAKGFS